MKKNRDVKFIIYQSLYIFVVCVIAIKGANLDLTQVVEDDGKPRAQISPEELQRLLDSLKKLTYVDTTQFVVIPKELLLKDQRLQEIVQNMPKIDLNNYMPKVDMSQYKKIEPDEEKKPDEPTNPQDIRIGQIKMVQYTTNRLNNPYDVPMEIVGIATIPAKSTKEFVTGGQSSVVVKVGSSTKTIELTPKPKPQIHFQRIATMGEDTRASSLQSSVCYRVVIEEEFPQDLDIKFNGPCTVKDKASMTYDITMNAFGSKGSYDNYTDGKNSPYTVGFTVSVSDKIAGYHITGQQSFIFGDW